MRNRNIRVSQWCGIFLSYEVVYETVSKLGLGHGPAKVLGHPDILFRIPAAGGEVTAHHDAVQAAGQCIGLQAPEVHFPSAGGADQRLRQDEAEHGKCAENFQRWKPFIRIEGGALHRIQDIHGDGVDVHGYNMIYTQSLKV